MSVEADPRKEDSLRWEGFVKKGGFYADTERVTELRMTRVVTGESTEQDNVTDVGRCKSRE